MYSCTLLYLQSVHVNDKNALMFLQKLEVVVEVVVVVEIVIEES